MTRPWLRLLGLALALPLAAQADADADATSALRAVLELRHPQVRDWSIQLLPCEDPTADTDGTTPVVRRIGRRSAVQVGTVVRWFAVSGRQPVVVLRQPLEPGARLRADLLEVAEREAFAVSCRSPAPDGAALETARRLRRGEMLCAADVRPVPAVHHGQTVPVEVMGERVAIHGAAVALDDGHAGDIVTALNPATRDVFVGRVTGSGSLVVDTRTSP